MANARQVARWIVDDIINYTDDVSTLDRAWRKMSGYEQRLIASAWMDIAEAYVKKYSGDDMQAIHHINGDPCDNRPENLRVVTVNENTPVPGRVPRKRKDWQQP
jgi:hypothetical protein